MMNAGGRAKLGQVLTESSYGNLAKLAVRCCNVHLYPTVVQDVVCTSSTCAVVACSVCGNVQPDFYFSPNHQRGAAIPARTLVQRYEFSAVYTLTCCCIYSNQ